MSRTNVVLDGDLVERDRTATGIETLRAPIDRALRELLRRESRKKILELEGKVRWESNLTAWRRPRMLRSRRSREEQP